MAEGVFAAMVQKRGLEGSVAWDSAGTSGFHAGEQADERMMETAHKHGLKLTHRSRKLLIDDFSRFDYMLSMDSANLDIILALQKKAIESGIKSNPKILMMRSFDPDAGSGGNGDTGADVPDPYYSDIDGFEEVYEMLVRSSENLLDFIEVKELKRRT
jgi:protein-tyrosine phosphatase